MDIPSSINLGIEAFTLLLQYTLPYIAVINLLNLCLRFIMNAIFNGDLRF